ncbi:TPA: hypothetical protein RG679_004523 [Vibrio diabolicus]|nr:hypothetical protein [Vibrio diabolicus]
MIKKVIHYVWIGSADKPDFVNSCIRNWKLTLPEYQFIEWNEQNLNMEQILSECDFVKLCYEKKLWAYVSDYIRLKVLYEYGGVYLDTDITLEKDITPLLDTEFFIGMEDETYISAGIIGTVENNVIIKKILDFYKNDIMSSDIYTIPKVITHVIEKNNFQTIGNIYPPEFFYPYHYSQSFSENYITDNTYCIHWWGKSWIGGNIAFLETKHLQGFRRILSKIRFYIINCVKNRLRRYL